MEVIWESFELLQSVKFSNCGHWNTTAATLTLSCVSEVFDYRQLIDTYGLKQESITSQKLGSRVF